MISPTRFLAVVLLALILSWRQIALAQAATGASASTEPNIATLGSPGKAHTQGTLDIADFGAIGDAISDDTAAIQAAIDRAELLSTIGSRRGATIKFPPGQYRVTAPLIVRQSRISFVGAGRYQSQLIRSTDYGNTLEIGAMPLAILEQIEIKGLSFHHDRKTVGMRGTHIQATAVTHLTIVDFSMQDSAFGIVLRGCVDFVIQRGSIVGRNNGVDKNQTGVAGILLKHTPVQVAGVVPIPTQGIIRDTQVFGPHIAGFKAGLVVNAAEQLTIDGSSYFGNASQYNVLLEQTSNNQPILEVTFSPGVYIDGAGLDSVLITGKDGDGTRYIGQVKFDGVNIKGQSGDSTNGIRVDGTERRGRYSQAVRGLHVANSTISGMKANGLKIDGGVHVVVTGNDIKGNNYFNNANGSGIVLGPGVSRAMLGRNRIGATPEGSATSYQRYGIEISRGAQLFTVDGNDVRNNALGGILDNAEPAGLSGKTIINNVGYNGNRKASSPEMPPSTADFVNPFGSPAYVSIYGGNVSSIKLNGTVMFTRSGVQFHVAPADIIQLTYAAAPNWIWWPQ